MKRGDEVWIFIHRCRNEQKTLEKGFLVLKHDGLWHVKTKKRFYKRKECDMALVRQADKALI